MRIQAAGIGQNPHAGLMPRIVLQAYFGSRLSRRNSIGADAQHGQHGGTIAFHLDFQACQAIDQFTGRQLIGAGGGACHEVGEAAAQRQQIAFMTASREIVNYLEFTLSCPVEQTVG
jgi:hypothetical protein